MSRSARWASAVAVVAALTACGGGGGTPGEGASDAAIPSDGATASAPDPASTPPASAAPTGDVTPSLAGEPVDACAILTREEAEQITGTEVDDPTSSQPMGSLLGDCTYYANDFSSGIALSARPAAEYQSTVDFYRAEVVDVTVPGASGAVFGADVGVVMQPEGADYMLQLTVFSGEGDLQGRAAHTAAAEVTLRS